MAAVSSSRPTAASSSLGMIEVIDPQDLPEDDDHERAGLGRVKCDDWTIGIVDAPIGEFAQVGRTFPVTWVRPPLRGTFLADPFAVDATTVLCEEFVYRRAHGRLIALTLDGERVTGRRLLLDEPHHLSYPFVVHDGDRVWVVPEQAGSGRVDLFEWDSGGLRFERTLIDGLRALDPTLSRHGSGWEMSFSEGDLAASGESLTRWSAPELQGPWSVVPQAGDTGPSPIPGAPCNRPAGPLFGANGANGPLLRPTQDCRGGYGRGVLISSIAECNGPDGTNSVLACLRLASGPYNAGIHTISPFGAERTLVDGKRRTVRADALLGRARRRLSRARQGRVAGIQRSR
jgi:hypothetical protein